MTTPSPIQNQNLAADLRWFVDQVQPKRHRSMRQFAEAEIVIPDGPYTGSRFRCSRQPYSGLWFDAVDSGQWSRCVATGPTQSGKTLSCFVIPLLYHLFEIGETVITGLPDMDMGGDKWREDILPAIEASRYRDLLPQHGGGSRGGRVESILFRHGPTLKFMSGGGSDKSRAGFTSKVVVITETDGMDQPGGKSREADKITQLEARTKAYSSKKQIYMECTVSTEEGRTWREYQEGTRSRLALPCPHCRSWVTPEREHLVGWKEAQSQVEAEQKAFFACPDCGEAWTEEHRKQANLGMRLVHEGQSLNAHGEIEGDPPPTDTLGFRWSAVNNLFATAGHIGGEEWKASRSTDEENAEKSQRQFVWALPSLPVRWDRVSLEARELAARTGPWARGIVPQETLHLTAAIDLGKYLCHWIVVAWMKGATGHVVDYGRIEVATDDLGTEKAIVVALKQFADMVSTGWPREGEQAKNVVPQWVWIDAGYMIDAVYAFCRQAGRRPFMPAVGRGATQQRNHPYSHPTKTSQHVKHVGEQYYISFQPAARMFLVDVNADHWKTWVHRRLAVPMGNPGAMTFFQAPPHEHLSLAKHLTAEVEREEFVAGKGSVVRWEKLRKDNHWFDALYNAAAAGHLAGVKLIDEQPAPVKPRRTLEQMRRDTEGSGFRRADGSPWIDVERWKANWERLQGG